MALATRSSTRRFANLECLSKGVAVRILERLTDTIRELIGTVVLTNRTASFGRHETLFSSLRFLRRFLLVS